MAAKKKNARATSSQPAIKQPPVLFKQTQHCIAELEDMLGGPLLTYWNNPRGSVCHSDVIALFGLLEEFSKSETLYLYIKSFGGNGKASLRFVNLLRRYCDRLVALVPLECASAATMIALGADEIQMGPMAYLTAVDTSLTHDLSPTDIDNDRVGVSLDELKRVVRLWKNERDDNEMNPYHALFEHVHPLVIGAVDRADSLSLMICKELLSYHQKDRKKIESIAQALNSKYPSHGYPIMENEARQLGLPATAMDSATNSALLKLHGLYSEMGQKATTDFDESNAHGNEIINILETRGTQVYFQQDKDWYYRNEERRWVTLNDKSSWRKVFMKGRTLKTETLHTA